MRVNDVTAARSVGSMVLVARAPAMWRALPAISRGGVTALVAGVATQVR